MFITNMDYAYVEEKIGDDFVGYVPGMKPVRMSAKTKEELKAKLDACVKLYVARHPEVVKTLRTSSI